jgi:hypothetical protein
MANNVFANGREISCKKADGKTICEFPDVCFTPPENPATPPGVPVPYPNTAFSKDTTEGSKSVKISGQEVMLKNVSYFKTSTGDEAGSAAKKGIITSTNKGKAYFISWSMDVKYEGKNVVRHLDMTTNNHASPMATGSAPWPFADKQAVSVGGVCHGVSKDLKLRPYKPGCPASKTGHHLIPGRCMRYIKGYSHSKAPVICVTRGNQHAGSHKRCHLKFDPIELKYFKRGKNFSYPVAKNAAASSAGQALNPPRNLSAKEKKCVAAQLDAYYKQKNPKGPGCTDSSNLRASGERGKALPRRVPRVSR